MILSLLLFTAHCLIWFGLGLGYLAIAVFSVYIRTLISLVMVLLSVFGTPKYRTENYLAIDLKQLWLEFWW